MAKVDIRSPVYALRDYQNGLDNPKRISIAIRFVGGEECQVIHSVSTAPNKAQKLICIVPAHWQECDIKAALAMCQIAHAEGSANGVSGLQSHIKSLLDIDQ